MVFSLSWSTAERSHDSTVSLLVFLAAFILSLRSMSRNMRSCYAKLEIRSSFLVTSSHYSLGIVSGALKKTLCSLRGCFIHLTNI